MLEMKESGIEWVGNIPKHWKFDKAKYHFTNNKYVVGIKSVDFDRLALTLKGVIHRDKEDNEGLQPNDFNTYQLLKAGELVFKLIDLQNVSTSRIGLAHDTGIVSPAYIILSVNKDINPAFAEKFFLMMWHREIFNALGDAGVRSSLNAGDLLNVRIPVPPIEEQNRIAEFLDDRCAEIDAISSEIQEQINTLEEYKKSVITETVTKGLNPNAEMKDSGIEWVGKIPKSWNTHPLYCYFSERKNKNRLGKEQNLLSLSYGKIIRKDINTNDGLLPENFNSYNIVEQGDIIIRPTDLQNDKRSLRTGLTEEHGIITSAYLDLKPKEGTNSRYFHYLLHSYDIQKVFYNMGNGVRQGLNYSEFSKLMVIEPSEYEQNEIADYLDLKCAEIEGAIADKQKQLETLEEYKKTLIYEYVTGKKEVA